MKIVIFLIALCSHLAASTPDFSRFAFTLEVKESGETYRNGTGCFVKTGDAIYYITARHIFEDISESQRAALVKSCTIVSESSPRLRFAPDHFTPIPNAQNMSKTDVMIIKMKPNPALSGYTVALAPTAPLKDEIVYLATRLPDHPLNTYPLKIIFTDSNLTAYEKTPGIAKYTGASGGPILNSSGQLVGTYLGRSLTKGPNPDISALVGTPHSSLVEILTPLK